MARTVKCKIALVVDQEGAWCAGGSSNANGEWYDGFNYILDAVEPGKARYWVTVEVPVPEVTEVPEIEGEVSRG